MRTVGTGAVYRGRATLIMPLVGEKGSIFWRNLHPPVAMEEV